jgi:hypothetical protein
MLRNQLRVTVAVEATEESERFMLGASKILTVSYGTFSCTLEGFDDPFSTMKGIAEYFRDLAADDRYFGAEPPTPDAAMLQHIAEREIQRRVEAKINANGVVLRQTDQSQDAPAHVPVSGPRTIAVAAPAVVEAPAAVAAAPSDAADEDMVYAAPDLSEVPATPQADDDSVSAKLARIRAAVAASRAAAATDHAAAAYEDDALPVADAGPSQDFAFDLDLSDDTAPAAEDTAEPVAEPVIDLEVYAEPAAQHDASTEEQMIDDVARFTAEDGMVDDVAIEQLEEPDLTDLAALDGASLAEVEAAADDTNEVIDAFEAEIDETTVPNIDGPTEVLTSDDALMSSLVSLTGDAARTAPAADVALHDADISESAMEDTIAGLFTDAPAAVDDDIALPETTEPETAGDHDAHLADADDLPQETAEADYEDQDAGDDAVDPALAAMFDAADETDGAELAADVGDMQHTDADGNDDDAAADVIAASDANAADLPEAEAAEEPAPRPGFLQRARARVIKVRASDFIPDEGAAAPVAAELHAEGLSADEEADLIAELERAERDADGEGEGGRAILENSGTDNEAAVSRLMDEANTKLEGAESRRRFSAIAHLKAAVAATVADRKMKSKDAPAEVRPADDDVTDRYRDDLSKAVRPRRPSADAGTMTQRPSMDTRPAPLVLVSEQRIDRSSANDAAAVRPRRITSGAMTAHDDDADLEQDEDIVLSPEDARNFADFAEKLGASNLAELLEAAAAYTSTVEGRPHFSRPQILSKVANVAEDDDYTREDGLRSFGMLLRQGKIQKVRRGQFMIADSSKFMTEARRAAR